MSDVARMVTRRWRSIAALAVCIAWIPVVSAFADHRAPFDGSEHDYGEMVDYDLVFPVAGDHSLRDTFYASRSSGQHHAQDIMAPKMTPIVAAASGTIKYINWSRNPADLRPDRCCTMVITHDDGWESWYIHMNNDTPGTDDGEGWGIAAGLVPGMRVAAGQLIGWVGDSGNAEYTGSHLHYELYDPEGVIVNPYQALLNASDAGVPFANLAVGSTGQNVLRLQVMLAVLGFDPGPADGAFGSLTGAAVSAFQTGVDLAVTGVVDGTTWSSIQHDYADAIVPPDRLAGSDRYGTAVAVAGSTHPGTASIVFLAVGTNYPDAIGAGPAASALDAPILLVQKAAIPTATRSALQRMAPDTVYLLGGTAAIGPGVETAVRDLLPGTSVQRLAGANRYETAVAVSQAGFPNEVETVYVVTGGSFPDALVAAPAAVADGAPVLLVARTSIPAAVSSELQRLSPQRIVIVGGTSAVSSTVLGQLRGFAPEVQRVAGSNRYATAVAISQLAFPGGADTVYIAVGDRFPDALAGGSAIGRDPGPLLLVERDAIPLIVAAEIQRLAPNRVVIFGGPAAVSQKVGSTLVGLPAAGAPPAPPGPPPSGPPEITYDPALDSEQWRPLVEYVFALWELDTEKCGTGSNSGDCIGSQVDNAIIIMECESLGDPTIVNSSSGTTGLFQHRPVYWDSRVTRVRSHFPGFPADATPYDPYDNVMVAALLVHESRDALIGENSLTGPWDDGPAPWGHWDGSSRSTVCHDPPLVSP